MAALEKLMSDTRLCLMRVNESCQALALSYQSCDTRAMLNDIYGSLKSALGSFLSFDELHRGELLEWAIIIEVSLARFIGEAELLFTIYETPSDAQRKSLPARIISFKKNFSEWFIKLYPTSERDAKVR
jgi:hypothetical protein